MLSPEEIAISVTATAIAMVRNLEPLDIALLASVVTQLGDTLTTLSVAKEKRDIICKQLAGDTSSPEGGAGTNI